MAQNDFDIPEGLSDDVRQAAETIVKTIRETCPDASGGGCRLFYTVDEWKARQEEYGTTGELILCHDGGAAAPFLNWDYMCYQLRDKLMDRLRPLGFYVEQCTSWYSAMYRID